MNKRIKILIVIGLAILLIAISWCVYVLNRPLDPAEEALLEFIEDEREFWRLSNESRERNSSASTSPLTD